MRTGFVATRCLIVLSLAIAGSAAFAIDIGFEGEAGNLQLPWTPVAPIADSQFPVTNYFWGGQAWLAAPLGEDASIRVSYDRDPVLRNTAIATVQFERGIAKISVGPLLGFLNSDSAPISAGISASVRLQWPGVAYVALRSDGGTAVSILQAGVDPQARTELSAGFYVPNAILSGLISAKRFNELDASGNLVTDTLTRYAMTIDVFKKNVPYTALLSVGYELRSKHYAGASPAAAVTDSLGAIVMGVDATAQVSDAVKLLGGISTGAYVFGLDALKGRGPANSSFLFTASFGMSIDTAAIRITPKLPAEEKPEPTAPEGAAPEAAPKETTPPAATPATKEEPPAETPANTPAPAPAAVEKPAAPAPTNKIALDAGAGLYYNNRINLTAPLTIIGAVLNLRGGLWGSVGYHVTPALVVGAEVGFDYITFDSSGVSASLFDIPVRANVRYNFGAIALEGFGGLFFDGVSVTGAGAIPVLDFDAGARIRLAGFYIEGSYVIGVGSTSTSFGGFGSIEASYPRFGLGYVYSILK